MPLPPDLPLRCSTHYYNLLGFSATKKTKQSDYQIAIYIYSNVMHIAVRKGLIYNHTPLCLYYRPLEARFEQSDRYERIQDLSIHTVYSSPPINAPLVSCPGNSEEHGYSITNENSK